MFKIFGLVVLIAAPAFANMQKALIEVRPGHTLYVETFAAAKGQPTVVLVNGLTYKTSDWDELTQEFQKRGIGVVRFDMIGMGKTLERAMQKLDYASITQAISYKDQAIDLNLLVRHLRLKEINIVGLSYGGGIGLAYASLYPHKVNQLIAMAPYVHSMNTQEEWIKQQIKNTRLAFPLNPASDQALDDYYLRWLIYTTYPVAEPSLLEGPNPVAITQKIEAVLRMVQGIRHWRADSQVTSLPTRKLHLMIAGEDEYVPREMMEGFWADTPVSKRGSKIVLKQSGHKMNLADPRRGGSPAFVATWVQQILQKNPAIFKHQVFEADLSNNTVYYSGGNFRLPQTLKENSNGTRSSGFRCAAIH